MAYECSRCKDLSEYCAEFISPRQSEVPTAQSLCYCGHFFNQHSHTIPQIPSRPLPLKGGCALNGCTKFTSHSREPVAPKSICQCGMSWLAHSSENSSLDRAQQVDVPFGQTFQPQFSPWQPPEPPNSTVSTNGRRVIAYTNHRPASSTSRSTSISIVSNNRASRRAGNTNSNSDSARAYRFDIAIFCHPLSGADRDEDEAYLRKIWISKFPQLIERLRNNHLIINIDTFAQPTENATEFLNNSIIQHMSAHNITFPPSPDPHITQTNQSDLQANFYRIPWRLIKVGYLKTSREGSAHTLAPSDIPYHEMTWHKLISNQAGTRKELHRLSNPTNNCPIIFICPSFGKGVGPIFPGSTQEHPCFASRIAHGLFSGLLNETLTSLPSECFDACPTVMLGSPKSPLPSGIASPGQSVIDLSCSPDLGPIHRTPSPSLLLRSPSPVNPITPLPSQPTFSEHQHWRDVIDTNLKESDEHDEGQFFMTANDIDLASNALLEFIIAQHSGEENLARSRQSALNVRIRKHSSIAGLFFSSSVTLFVGRGCGDGVIRAVLHHAIQKMISDEKYWRFRLDEDYSSLVHREETSSTRCLQIKCYASLIMIALFYGITPDPISPFLLASILEGDSLLYDKEFINAMAPATARLISHWPEDDTQLPLPNNQIHLLLSKVDLEYRDILDYTGPQLKRLKQRLIHEILIGSLEKSEMDAFRDGFNLRIADNVPNIALTLQGSIKPLFLNLYTRRVKDPKQVLDLIKIDKLQEGETLTGDENSEDNLLYNANHVNALGERFILHFRHYLHGRGHPDNFTYNDLISLANRKAANDEPAFRARQFLSCMSSLPFLPLKEETLEIRFIRGPANHLTRPADAPNDWRMSPLPLYFHTCMYYADLPITLGLVDLLNAPVPDDILTISDFDLWLHQSIFPINHIADGAETFNQA